MGPYRLQGGYVHMNRKYSILGMLLPALLATGCLSDQGPGAETPAQESGVGDSRAQTSASQTPSDSNSGNRSSLPTNPSQLRAQATPKTLENVRGLSGYEEVKLLNPPSFSLEMKQKGQALYEKTCARCHGEDGTPHDPKGTLARYSMVNLANPLAFKYGADARGIYRSIAFGTAAPPHGTYKGAYTQQEIWSLVAYVETLDAR